MFCDQRYRDGKKDLEIPGVEGSDVHGGDEGDPGDRHPYEVTHEKVLTFFKDFLFKKPTSKKLYLNKNYSYPFVTYRDIDEKDPVAAVIRRPNKKNGSCCLVDLKKIVDALPEHQDGRYRYKKLQVCLGIRVMHLARAALSFLLKRQNGWRPRRGGP
ncbi:hypothetical protein DFQ26_000497 [Actinomortierella ambigua]|nr:hypothetical protein DFQ26_000497 [Actinomortierella ambigua]